MALGRSGKAAAKSPAPEPKKKRIWLRRLIAVGLLGTLLGLVVFMIAYAFTKVPKPSEVEGATSALIMDASGKPIGRVGVGEQRQIVPTSSIPEVMRNATIAAEDRDFFKHGGVSLPGIVRAALANILARRVEQGGSTITQQYVKNAFLTRERTFSRKIREALVSVKLERSWSKDEIIHAYLNTIYFGRGSYGVEAASRAYFGIEAARLNLEQSALLAGIIRAPEALDPSRKVEAARKARSRVLLAMTTERMITEEQRAEADPKPIVVRSRAAGVSGRAPHFLEAVRRDLIARFGEKVVTGGGLRVTTTLQLAAQDQAEKAVAAVLDRPDDPEVALVAVEPATGSVRALVGGRSFAQRQFDHATQGRRQPGSAFKPFVLSAHVEQGGLLTDQFDAPASITLATGGKPWNVSNYDNRGYGRITVERATESSVNTVYAQIALKVGPDQVAGIARNLGVRSKLEPVASLALGTEETTPLELTSAYASLANDGNYVSAHLITRVVNGAGRQLYRFSEAARRVMNPRSARLVTKALGRVIEVGTGRRADLGRPAAGKTGTTENFRDAWFAGYTPQLAASVWMGYPDGERTMRKVRGISVTGGSFPAQIWKAFMSAAHERLPVREFLRPEDAAPISPSPAPSTTTAPSTPQPTGTIPPDPVPTVTQSSKPTMPPPPPPSTPPPATSSPAPTSSPSPTSTQTPAGISEGESRSG